MKTNIIKQAGDILTREHHGEKPPGIEYLYQDGNTKNKAHHIIIDRGGNVYYNQAINYPEGWCDFYAWDLVPSDYKHGYQEYIDQAMSDKLCEERAASREAARAHRKLVNTVLVPGRVFDLWSNQKNRDAYVLAVIGKEALVEFEMPNGSVYLNVLDRNLTRSKWDNNNIAFQWIRTVQRHNLAKKWVKAIDEAEIAVGIN